MNYSKINRRTFVKKAIYGSIIAGAGWPLIAGSTDTNDLICILHTNDTHSRLDPYPANDPNFPNMGGYARRATLISQIRQSNKNVLLLDAGDIFQGTPYYNVYGGEPELLLMSKMGYDAATMGNHEFDNGLDGFNKVLPNSRFPFITSNYDFSNTILNGKTIPWKVFNYDGIRIGVYGLGVELEGLVGRNLYGDTIYLDPIEKAREMEHLLKTEQECNIIVCISHLGFEYTTRQVSDQVVARQTQHTDIILGGHTHTVIDPLFKTTNAAKQPVYIGQTGYAGVRLGRIDIIFNRKNQTFALSSHTTNIFKNQVV